MPHSVCSYTVRQLSPVCSLFYYAKSLSCSCFCSILHKQKTRILRSWTVLALKRLMSRSQFSCHQSLVASALDLVTASRQARFSIPESRLTERADICLFPDSLPFRALTIEGRHGINMFIKGKNCQSACSTKSCVRSRSGVLKSIIRPQGALSIDAWETGAQE